MQLLPNLKRALIRVEKLRDYVLDAEHPKNGGKAKAFRDLLGIERRHAKVLAELIFSSLGRSPAIRRGTRLYGEHWATYHDIVGFKGQAVIVTVIWIMKTQQPDTPVLVSCYIERKKQEELRKLIKG